jgi:hypothetical protein
VSIAFAMHPLLSSSDFDPMQMAIIVIAVLAGFVKWLWETWQQKSGATPARQAPDPEEQRLREAAWRKQTGQSSAPRTSPPVAAPSPWEELRKAWKELQEVAKPTPARSAPSRTPPPVPSHRLPPPQRQPRQQPLARVPAPPPAPAAAIVVPSQIPVVASAPAVVVSRSEAPAGSVLATLRNLRRDPALMRQAILMQEILGPPKALQSSRDFAI